jgi:predicted transcriptional regulator
VDRRGAFRRGGDDSTGGRFSEEEKGVISTLRGETARRVISIILERPRITHGSLASTLGISSQGLMWLMGRLKEEGAVGVESDCRYMRHTINEGYRETLVDCLNILA